MIEGRLTAQGGTTQVEQVRKQLGKVVPVVKVRDFADVDYVERDLMLIRIHAPAESRPEIIDLTNLFRGRVSAADGQSVTADCDGLEIRALANGPVSIGDPVAISIRAIRSSSRA